MRTNFLPATEARFRGSRDMIVGQDGNVNAGTTRELMQRLVDIASMIKDGEIVAPGQETASGIIDPRKTAQQHLTTLREAYADTARWAELGAAISQNIDNRLEREGFMRSTLNRGTLNDGEYAPRIRVKVNQTTAVVSRGPVQVYPKYIRGKYITADEFYISSLPRVEELELRRGSGDMLEEIYFDGLEAILVVEDRTLLAMLRGADGIDNPVTYFNGAFTPSLLQATKTKVEQWRLPVDRVIMSIDLLNDLTTGSDYSTWFDPISKWEIVQTGRIGRVLGMDILTDGYREQQLQVLNPGEFIVMTSGNYLGGFTDRGPVQSRPVDQFDDMVPARGWSMLEIVSMAVANSKGVARGVRL